MIDTFRWALNSWPDLFLIGLTMFMCVQYQDAIRRAPETREEYLPGAEHRVKTFLWAAAISALLTVVTHGRPESSLFSDIGFTLSLLICWWYNRWFLRTIRQALRK